MDNITLEQWTEGAICLEPYVCRICHGEQQQRRGLIAPCLCSGSQAYVHRTCLDQWRRAQLGNGNDRAAHVCPTCKMYYILDKTNIMALFTTMMWEAVTFINLVVWVCISWAVQWAGIYVCVLLVRSPTWPTRALFKAALTETNAIMWLVLRILAAGVFTYFGMPYFTRVRDAATRTVAKLPRLRRVKDFSYPSTQPMIPHVHTHNTRSRVRLAPPVE